jgi:uncharacterized protein YqeY
MANVWRKPRLLKAKLHTDMIQAMKNHEELRLSVIRMAKTLITNKEKDKMTELSDDQIQSILSTMIKQRQDSVEQFTKGNRPELAAKETLEIAIIADYLPKEISREELVQVLATIMGNIKDSIHWNIGYVMKELKATGLSYNAKDASELVKERLGEGIGLETTINEGLK